MADGPGPRSPFVMAGSLIRLQERECPGQVVQRAGLGQVDPPAVDMPGFGHRSQGLHLLDRIDAEIGLEVHVRVDDLRGIAGGLAQCVQKRRAYVIRRWPRCRGGGLRWFGLGLPSVPLRAAEPLQGLDPFGGPGSAVWPAVELEHRRPAVVQLMLDQGADDVFGSHVDEYPRAGGPAGRDAVAEIEGRDQLSGEQLRQMLHVTGLQGSLGDRRDDGDVGPVPMVPFQPMLEFRHDG